MSVLHVYGDSFASPRETWRPVPQDGHAFPCWYEHLRDLLGCKTVYAHGLPGTSCLWTFTRLLDTATEHRPEDYVVVVLTDPARHWFFWDRPDLSNFLELADIKQHISKDEIKALTMYYKYLRNEEIEAAEFRMAIRAIMGSTCANLRVLSGFANIGGQIGNLTLQSIAEYQGGIHEMNRRHLKSDGDPRLHHFHETNHLRLAELIHGWFTVPGSQIDLTQLHENIYK